MARFIWDLFSYTDYIAAEKDGLVRVQTHPDDPMLHVANYTAKAQWSRTWNDVTTQCRGLIFRTDGSGEIVARPWPKFFNYGEDETVQIPDTTCIYSPKQDGSLGILYPKPDDNGAGFQASFAIATRGSFTSDQAKWASERFTVWAIDCGFSYDPAKSYLFEIIYPENRIVVDYQGFEGLVLLDILDTASGLPDLEAFANCPWPHKAEKQICAGMYTSLLKERIKDDEEGFVLYWPDVDLRLKLKGETYLRLHRIITNCTAKTIWEHLRDGEPLSTLLDNVPDEFYQWVNETAAGLQRDYNHILHQCQDDFDYMMMCRNYERHTPETKKKFALELQSDDHPYKSIMFAFYDDKPYKDMIWKLVRPNADKPFFAQGEDVS